MSDGRTHEPRRAGRADLGSVTALWIALTRHHETFDPAFALRPGAEVEARALIDAQLRDPQTAIFLIGDAAAPAAFATVHVSRAPPIHPERCRAEITDLYVEPDARRRGLGRTLVASATAWAVERGAERIEVRVVTRNPEGRAFWNSVGFGAHVDVLHRRM
jgi:GNAT superfamily N-acetyltransferase